MKKYLFIVLLVGVCFVEGKSTVVSKARLLHTSGLHEKAKELIIEDIISNYKDLELWSFSMLTLGDFLYSESKIAESFKIFNELLDRNPSYTSIIMTGYEGINLNNYIIEYYIVHEKPPSGKLSGYVTRLKNIDGYEEILFHLSQDGSKIWFTVEEVREFKTKLIDIVQRSPILWKKDVVIFENNRITDSGFKFKYVGKRGKKGKSTVEISYGKSGDMHTVANTNELQIVMNKADKKLTELGY